MFVAGPEVPTNTSRSDLGTACDNVLPQLGASNKRKLHQTGDHTVVFGNAANESMADMDLTGVMGVSNLPKSHSHKADVTTYGGEEGFTSGMDFTTCVGTLNPRLTDAGKGYSHSTVLWQADLLTKSLQSLGNSC